MQSALAYIKKNHSVFQADLETFLRIPSVSTEPRHRADVEQAAGWLAQQMEAAGLHDVSVLETHGHPVVFGQWLAAGESAPTVLVYGHYDVQPAAMEDGWAQDPFEPVIKDGRIIARGATDDKGQVMVQLKAWQALLATGTCPVNIKFLVEGEEEIGSPHLPAFVEEHREMLQADVCVVSDTSIRGPDQPSLVYGIRGLMTMELIVSGPRQDLHSGLGGMVHNPCQALAEIIAGLHDASGRVAVPGFYESVRDLTDMERRALARADLSRDEWDALTGAPEPWGEEGYTLLERFGGRPTLEINGIRGGYGGPGFKTVIGASAMAKISCRLVPDQDPDHIHDLVAARIRELAPATVRIELVRHAGGYPALTDPDHPALQAARAAYERCWGKEPLLMREGGSIPIVADFQRILDLPVVLLGFGLSDSRIHGPNENFPLEMFHRGLDTVVYFAHELAGRLVRS